MGTQDKLERVLRDIHVMISKSERYDAEGEQIIVEKNKLFEHLSHLNDCIYEMMDEYEVIKQSRDKGERDARRRGDEIIFQASRNAEDIYAASMLYSDEALQRVQEILRETGEGIRSILSSSLESMEEHGRQLKTNQLELKSQLEDMVDTEKYLKLIEERNQQLAKEKEEKKQDDAFDERSPYADIKPEIRIDPEYFRKAGISMEGAALQEEAKPEPAEIKVNLDSEYFKWKREQESE